MDPLTAATILDLLSRGGVLGAAAIMIWMLVTDRIQTKGRVQEIKDGAAKEIAEKDKLIDRLDQRLGAIENALARMHTPVPALPPPRDGE